MDGTTCTFFERRVRLKNSRRISLIPAALQPRERLISRGTVEPRWSLHFNSFGSNLYLQRDTGGTSYGFGHVSNEQIRPNGVWYPINRRRVAVARINPRRKRRRFMGVPRRKFILAEKRSLNDQARHSYPTSRMRNREIVFPIGHARARVIS